MKPILSYVKSIVELLKSDVLVTTGNTIDDPREVIAEFLSRPRFMEFNSCISVEDVDLGRQQPLRLLQFYQLKTAESYNDTYERFQTTRLIVETAYKNYIETLPRKPGRQAA